MVWETASIKKGFLSESTEPGEQGLWRLKTDGVNLQELWLHSSILDLSKVYTNNIHAMANTYGVEAACKAIIKASTCMQAHEVQIFRRMPLQGGSSMHGAVIVAS